MVGHAMGQLQSWIHSRREGTRGARVSASRSARVVMAEVSILDLGRRESWEGDNRLLV